MSMWMCVCGHNRSRHLGERCTLCAVCGEVEERHDGGHDYQRCDCSGQKQLDLRDAAFRAAVWGVIEARAKELKDGARGELKCLEHGDTIAAKHGEQIIAKAALAAGATKLVVTDQAALLEWVTQHHPTELVHAVNPAYLKALEARAKRLGVVVDDNGELVPGVELKQGNPYVSVCATKEAPFIVAQLLSRGRVSLDGIRELEAGDGD